MAFDIDMIKGVYANIAERILIFGRDNLQRPLNEVRIT